LYFFPYKYIDRSKFYTVKEIDTSLAFIQLKGRITGFRTEGAKYRQRLIARFTDDTGTMELVWFQGINWVAKNIEAGKTILSSDVLPLQQPHFHCPSEVDPAKPRTNFFEMQPQYIAPKT
jgi:RecG-like helicase